MDALAALAAEPAAAALCFDVDGTLAPIVQNPSDAQVPEITRAELRRLAGRYALVACITGRTSELARAIVGVPELIYVGEHGLELEPAAAEWSEHIRTFGANAGWPAEEKPLSVAFHYRTASDPEAARRQLEQIEGEARAQGLRTRWGRLVLEVLPPVEASKRTAVAHLLEQHGLSRALYAGDDATDLDAFSALDGLEVAVRVAVASSEAPAGLRERADLVVESPDALAELLAEL
jgi:trehalose 6-phosphate phosphatase